MIHIYNCNAFNEYELRSSLDVDIDLHLFAKEYSMDGYTLNVYKTETTEAIFIVSVCKSRPYLKALFTLAGKDLPNYQNMLLVKTDDPKAICKGHEIIGLPNDSII